MEFTALPQPKSLRCRLASRMTAYNHVMMFQSLTLLPSRAGIFPRWIVSSGAESLPAGLIVPPLKKSPFSDSLNQRSRVSSNWSSIGDLHLSEPITVSLTGQGAGWVWYYLNHKGWEWGRSGFPEETGSAISRKGRNYAGQAEATEARGFFHLLV